MVEAHGRIVETAFTEHAALLVRRLTAVTRDPEVAQDLVQDAFLRLAREVEAGRSPTEPRAWLLRVATNLAMSRGRHLAVVDRTAERLPRPTAPADPAEVVIQLEASAEVWSAMTRLSATERRALLLAAHGFAGAEIAETIGRTPGATRTLLCRARSKVRDRLPASAFATV
jgi:RNA polymerase sigma-70 factor (ECF subfamily)